MKIREDTDSRTEDFLNKLLPMFLVRQDKDTLGMGVVHKAVGQKGVEQGLDRGIKGLEMYLADLQLVLHLLIREVPQGFQLSKLLKLQPDQPLGSEGGEIGAASLDIEDLALFPDDVSDFQFDRGVSSAVKDKVRVLSDQSGGLKADNQGLGKGGELFRKSLCLLLVKPALHDFLFTSSWSR